MPTADTATRILDHAERLLQTRGYNGFAYKDIAAELGIRNASIHFHFPAKADLGVALAKRYQERFQEAVAELTGSPATRLQAFAQLFERTAASDDRLCLCGMLAAEVGTLPPAVATEVRSFFAWCRVWLTDTIAEGAADGSLKPAATPEICADVVLAALEGGMLLVRGQPDPQRYPTLTRTVLSALTG